MRIRHLVLLVCLLGCGLAARASAAPVPATFHVGAAAESLDPNLAGVDVYAGGFGASPPIRTMNDPIEARAFYVANDAGHAVAIAVVDAQAYFAAYQEGADYGIASVRQAAAAELHMSPNDIIVQATHTHAGATLEGIWGPVPLPYLKLVHDQTVKAIVDAAHRAQAAHIEIGTYDAPWIDNVDNNQTDSYPGWVQDGQVSVLRAVTPDGAPIATFDSVPAHGDIVEGSGEKKLSADYFGVVRAALDERLGGVNVVGPATLGREETPVQVGGIPVAKWFGGVVTSIVGKAITDGHWITDDTVASANTFTQVAGTNPLLLALVAANHLPDDQKNQMWTTTSDVQSSYPIDRQDTPPYQTGGVIGTDLTALRIGKTVLLSMPGEPFPEIRNAIAGATTGADHIIALSKGQDDWGYFYPAWAWGFTSLYDSDHNIFNVAPQAGDQVILDQSANVRTLGFPVDHAVSTPLSESNRYEQGLRPGVQAMADPTWGDARAYGTLGVVFTAIYNQAFVYDRPGLPGGDRSGPVHVDFGDGTSTNVTGDKRTRFTHDYAPGTYTATFTAPAQDGNVATWQTIVTVNPPLKASIDSDGSSYTANVTGGDGQTLSYEWTYADGSKAYGPTAPVRDGGVTLRVVDGTTTPATATA